MENNVFLYAESARRKAQKRKLAQSVEGGGASSRKGAAKLAPVPEHRPPRPPKAQTAAPTAPVQPEAKRAVKPGDEVIAAVPVVTSMSQVITGKVARTARKPTVVKVRVSKPVAGPGPVAPGASPAPPAPSARGLVASEERLLLESQEMDLFKTGKATKVAICPDCQHELVKVICLGTTVRACVSCKGLWLSYGVVRDFGERMDWFRQAGPAIQAALRPPEA